MNQKSDIKQKLSAWLDEQGYPLEMRVALEVRIQVLCPAANHRKGKGRRIKGVGDK